MNTEMNDIIPDPINEKIRKSMLNLTPKKSIDMESNTRF